MTQDERERITLVYVRVCRDSGFSLKVSAACKMTADILDLASPMVVWVAIGAYNLAKIASGTHMCLKLYRYGGTEETIKPTLVEEGDDNDGNDDDDDVDSLNAQ